jgi:16S rRNA (cytosine967-C5)-methyltransferase
MNIQKIDFLKKKFTEKFNSILLDAPCSALGTFRRNPDVMVKVNPSLLQKHQKKQLDMMQKSIEILNKSGYLIYIVCSFHPFETIDVIDIILQKHKDIKVHKINSDKMISRQNGYFINPLSFKDLGGSDIFFVSVLEKTK